jgi:NAD(P)-dependent dehydrogenase (short-subunit alcohol dehydrogenase family)
MDYQLSGKTALIVGGATGIGFASAQLMCQEGMQVAVADINAEAASAAAERLRALGFKALGIPVDVTDLPQVFAMVQNVEANLGPIDVLVNSAAVLDDKLFLESSWSNGISGVSYVWPLMLRVWVRLACLIMPRPKVVSWR